MTSAGQIVATPVTLPGHLLDFSNQTELQNEGWETRVRGVRQVIFGLCHCEVNATVPDGYSHFKFAASETTKTPIQYGNQTTGLASDYSKVDI